MRSYLAIVVFFGFWFMGCWQESRNVRFFRDTEAYGLAKAIEKGDLHKVEQLVRENPGLFNYYLPL